MNLDMEEYWDIYDENKQPTGRIMKRNDWNMQPGDFHLTVLGVVKRPSDGKYLITRRAMDKEWMPGCWEVPGGGVRAGESSRDAVLREVSEETGLNLDQAAATLLFTYERINPEEKNNYFVDVYEVLTDFDEDDVRYQKSEITEYEIADLETIQKYGSENIFMHYPSIQEAFRK